MGLFLLASIVPDSQALSQKRRSKSSSSRSYSSKPKKKSSKPRKSKKSNAKSSYAKKSKSSYGGGCAATTKKGTACKRSPSAESSYCWQHARMYGSQTPTRETSEEKTASSVKQFSGGCAATTQKGTACKRAPSSESKYCWQHAAMYDGDGEEAASSDDSDEEVLEE